MAIETSVFGTATRDVLEAVLEVQRVRVAVWGSVGCGSCDENGVGFRCGEGCSKVKQSSWTLQLQTRFKVSIHFEHLGKSCIIAGGCVST